MPLACCPESAVRYVAQHLPKLIEEMVKPNFVRSWVEGKIAWLRGLLQASPSFRSIINPDLLYSLQYGHIGIDQTDQIEGNKKFANFLTSDENVICNMLATSYSSSLCKTEEGKETEKEAKSFFQKQINEDHFAYEAETNFVLQVCLGFVTNLCSFVEEYELTITKTIDLPQQNMINIYHSENRKRGGHSCKL